MTAARVHRLTSAALALLASAACVHRAPADEHAGHAMPSAVAPAPAPVVPQGPGIPAGNADAGARLASSPRHGEWVMIPMGAGGTDSVRAWISFPERRTKAPVVVVVHEIFGLTTWVRGVADQLAAEGFIAVAPDYLTGMIAGSSPDNASAEAARAAIRQIPPEKLLRQTRAVADYATALPAANGAKWGIVGFCWGGSAVWRNAIGHGPRVGAGVVYYGTLADDLKPSLPNLSAPILGLYGEDDARVNLTIPATDSLTRAHGKVYEHHSYPGAGHGFLRGQADRAGANLRASEEAWPRTIAWFRRHLGG